MGMRFAFEAAQLARAAAAAGVPLALWLRAHDLNVHAWQQWLDRLRFLADVALPVVISAPVIGGDLLTGLQPLLLRAPHLLGVQVPEAHRSRWPLGQVGALRVGHACHDAAGLHAARGAGAAWATLSPVWPTPRKPDVSALGEAGLGVLAAVAGLPVVALGGIGPGQVAAAATAGAAAVAADRGLWDDPNAFLAAAAECVWPGCEARQGS